MKTGLCKTNMPFKVLFALDFSLDLQNTTMLLISCFTEVYAVDRDAHTPRYDKPAGRTVRLSRVEIQSTSVGF